MTTAPTYRIFISHATTDRDAALALAEWLKWLFEEDSFVATIGAGESWRHEMQQVLSLNCFPNLTEVTRARLA